MQRWAGIGTHLRKKLVSAFMLCKIKSISPSLFDWKIDSVNNRQSTKAQSSHYAL